MAGRCRKAWYRHGSGLRRGGGSIPPSCERPSGYIPGKPHPRAWMNRSGYHGCGGGSMAVHLLRRVFTVEEYHWMVDAGILREDDRVELLEGEIVEMTPIGSRHASGAGT